MSKVFHLGQYRLRRLSPLIIPIVEEYSHGEAEVLIILHPVAEASFQGVIEVEGYHEEVSVAEVEGPLLFHFHREVDVLSVFFCFCFV